MRKCLNRKYGRERKEMKESDLRGYKGRNCERRKGMKEVKIRKYEGSNEVKGAGKIKKYIRD